MTQFFPVTVCRSDGLTEVRLKSGLTELNKPTPAQLDERPDSDGMVDCYRILDQNEPKVLDWRRKLGGMLMRVLGGKAHFDRNYILKELPEGFVLWEHVKYKVDGSAEDKKQKGKHAAGPYERQDAYLYGHPQGRKKRYRSPADFFPHLIWLATDKENDRRNCSCKICSPDGDEETQVETVKAEVVKKEVKPPAPIVMKVAPPKPAAPVPAPLASVVRSAEQQLDADPNGKYLYRLGEMVWFSRQSGQGLAVIQKRQVTFEKPQYLIQPLSNPVIHPPYEIIDREDRLRPYLAWSVPEPPNMKEYAGLSFDQVPWERYVPGTYERNYEIDGSIFAAKAIDISYSFFDRIENPIAAPGEVHYNGMFLGAEKIWNGEPVRLRVQGKESVVMILQKIIERTTPPSTSTVTFVGDIYVFVEMPTPYKKRAEWPPPNTNLPARMIADLRFRNEAADIALRKMWHEWRLLEPAARKTLTDIKGRWYETRTMMPILAQNNAQQLQDFKQELARGITSDVGKWMNGTGDGSIAARQRKKNRRDTLGRAVAEDFKVSRGLDGPPGDNVFPMESAILNAASQPQPPQGDMADFVHFE